MNDNLNLISKIYKGYLEPTSDSAYYFDREKNLCSFQGKFVTISDHQVVESDNGGDPTSREQIYDFFTELKEREVREIKRLPGFLQIPAVPVKQVEKPRYFKNDKEKELLVKKVINNEFSNKLNKGFDDTDHKRIYRKIVNDYHTLNFDREQSKEQAVWDTEQGLTDFVRSRALAWKYCMAAEETSHHLSYTEYSIVNKITEYKTDAEFQFEEYISKLDDHSGAAKVMYRGGGDYELKRAKNVKLGLPAFCLLNVNQSGAGSIFGPGLYASKVIDVAKEYSFQRELTDLELIQSVNHDARAPDLPPPSVQNSVMLKILTRKGDKEFFTMSAGALIPTHKSYSISDLITPEAKVDTGYYIRDHILRKAKACVFNHRIDSMDFISDAYTVITNPDFVKKIKAYHINMTTKLHVEFSNEEIKQYQLEPKIKKVCPDFWIEKATSYFDALVIERPGSTEIEQSIFYENCKPGDSERASGWNASEYKFYTFKGPTEAMRVKPKKLGSEIKYVEQMQRALFAVQYARNYQQVIPGEEACQLMADFPQESSHGDEHLGAVGGYGDLSAFTELVPEESSELSGLVKLSDVKVNDVNVAQADFTNNEKRNCDICLEFCNENDEELIQLDDKDGHLRHQECHVHALKFQQKTKPEDAISGKMIWGISREKIYEHIARAGKDIKQEADGIIITYFEFQGPEELNGIPLENINRFKHFFHYMPNTLRGRQILKALKEAFNQGKVVTIDDSHTTGHYGLCFNMHLKTEFLPDTEHGYPSCNVAPGDDNPDKDKKITWADSLIDSLLSVGISINLSEEILSIEQGSVEKNVRKDKQ